MSNRPEFGLLSYPRSGNTWMRYCLEFMSRRPSNGWGRVNLREEPLGSTFNLGVDLDARPIVQKLHSAKTLRAGTYTRLVVILRDPLYSIPRHTGKIEVDQRGVKTFDDMLIGIAEFEGDKLIVEYEEFIRRTVHVVDRVCRFLDVPLDRLEEFEKTLKRHRIQCQMLYERVRTHRGECYDVELPNPEEWVAHFRAHPHYEMLRQYEDAWVEQHGVSGVSCVEITP